LGLKVRRIIVSINGLLINELIDSNLVPDVTFAKIIVDRLCFI